MELREEMKVAKSIKSSYPENSMDHYLMNRVLRHRLRNLCAGVKMTIERIATTTAKSNPQIGNRCDIIISELDNLRVFTDRMDMLFDHYPSSEKKSLFQMVTDLRVSFLQSFPFCCFELDGPELNVTFNNGSWLENALLELLFNAGEAAGENGTVTLSWENDNSFSFSICNDGDSIPETISLEPPVPFSTEKSRHDGLGLAIAYRTMKKIGADFSINSDETMTKVEIKLPEAEIDNE